MTDKSNETRLFDTVKLELLMAQKVFKEDKEAALAAVIAHQSLMMLKTLGPELDTIITVLRAMNEMFGIQRDRILALEKQVFPESFTKEN